MIMLAISDSLRIVELRQTVELLTHRLDSLGNHTRSFYDALPSGMGWFALVFGIPIAVLTFLIGWNALRATLIPKKLKMRIKELEYEIGLSVLATGMSFKAQGQILYYFRNLTDAIERMSDVKTNEDDFLIKTSAIIADIRENMIQDYVTYLTKDDIVTIVVLKNDLDQIRKTTPKMLAKIKELSELYSTIIKELEDN